MNYAIAFALVGLLALLTLASYVDRLYSEIGKFLSREFQDNIDAFEQKIEPKLGVSRARAALSMAVLTQLTIAAIAMLVGIHGFSRSRLEHLRNSAGHAQPDSHRHCFQSLPSVCAFFADKGHVARWMGLAIRGLIYLGSARNPGAWAFSQSVAALTKGTCR